jgi:hypothetical protein
MCSTYTADHDAAQVCERLVDSNMSHGVSIKMIIEAFNPSLPATLRNLFKPTASIQPPPQALSALARPATAATTSASASSPNSRARDALEETHAPFATHGRPGTSYTDAGIRRCFPFCTWHSHVTFFVGAGVSEGDSAQPYMPGPIVKLKVDMMFTRWSEVLT